MNRNDIITLLAPALMFALVIAGVIATAGMFHRDLAAYDYGQQKIETLIDNVQSGKSHLTTNEWTFVNASQKFIEADRDMIETAAEAVRAFAWCALVGIGLQIAAIFHIKKRWKKMPPDN
ncbi:MAG TPA: hypothetical protein VHG71_05160 [Verrucomicrobiae bacterium]|nr:hypothetical protein [Verrucomicrobiae bacterium]